MLSIVRACNAQTQHPRRKLSKPMTMHAICFPDTCPDLLEAKNREQNRPFAQQASSPLCKCPWVVYRSTNDLFICLFCFCCWSSARSQGMLMRQQVMFRLQQTFNVGLGLHHLVSRSTSGHREIQRPLIGPRRGADVEAGTLCPWPD